MESLFEKVANGSGLVRARGLKLSGHRLFDRPVMSGLVRARGLKHMTFDSVGSLSVRARKSPWIETYLASRQFRRLRVRARKSPWIETQQAVGWEKVIYVRARKSPWIETVISITQSILRRQGS